MKTEHKSQAQKTNKDVAVKQDQRGTAGKEGESHQIDATSLKSPPTKHTHTPSEALQTRNATDLAFHFSSQT